MYKVSALGALGLMVLAAGILVTDYNGRIAHGDDWAMASRDSRLVESVLSLPVEDDFYGLAYAAYALRIMRIEEEAELAATAFERGVLTAWIDTSASPPIRPDQTVREAIERERHLSRASLIAMRQEAIVLAQQRRIPDGSHGVAYNLAIPLAPYRAVLNADRARVAPNHPAIVAAHTRVRESSCSERDSCRRTFMRSEAAGMLPVVFGAGTVVGLALALLNRRLRRARSTTGQSTAVGCSVITLALLSGPAGVIALWFAVFSGKGAEMAWIALPGVALFIGVPISIVALVAFVLSRRWLA